MIDSMYKNEYNSTACQGILVIPATQEAEIGESRV
jgi:hypothetical protein